MKSAEEHRAAWKANTELRVAWHRILQSPEWEAVSTMVQAEATAAAAKAAAVGASQAADPVLARALMQMQGALTALRSLQNACIDAAPPPPEVEEFDDDYMRKLQAQKRENH